MTEQDNKKLAEWAGFIWKYTSTTELGWFIDGKLYSFSLPDFPNNLNACFKHLVPQARAKWAEWKFWRVMHNWMQDVIEGKEPALTLCEIFIKEVDYA